MTAPGNSQTAEFRFALQGVYSKVAPDLLKDGQYRGGQNLMAVQEGAVSSRNGSRTLGQFVGIAGVSQVRKLVVSPQNNPVGDVINPRYLSMNATLFRATNLAAPPTQVTGSFLPLSGPGSWEMASYAAGSSGNPWAFFACAGAMFKDNGASPYAFPLRNWGILPAYGVALAADSGFAGTLDGGAINSPPGSQPYDYVYTYFSSDTNNEGNPSIAMTSNSTVVNGIPLSVHLHSINVTVWGTDDPQVTHIRVYRRGGTLTDGVYRLCFVVIGAPGLGVSNTFQDNVPDADLVFAPQLAIDNDPPVTSTVPAPILGTITNLTGGNPGRTIVSVSISTANLLRLTRGSTIHFSSTAASENAVIDSINAIGQTVTCYLQYAHANGDSVEIDSITNQPCTLAISYQDCVLVAGDPNNPHVLYKSKTGFPEAFPVGTDAAGAVTQTPVGSPSNGILNMTEFRGAVALLNVSAIYETTILNGSLVAAIRVADKGLLVRDGWCKTEIELWILTADGIYTWDGGIFRKRSEAIDPVFHNEQVNGIAPMNMTSPFARMSSDSRGRVHLLYQDINGNYARWVCDPQHGDRWVPFTDNGNAVQALYQEPDTQGLLVIRESGNINTITVDDQSAVFSGQTYTSDIWSGPDPRVSGFGIFYSLLLPWFDLGDPVSEKLFEEVFLDLDPQLFANGVYREVSSLFVDIYLNYSDTVVETIQISIPSGTAYQGRTLVSLLPQTLARGAGRQSFGWEARSISFQIRGTAYPTQPTFYRLLFKYQPTGAATAGATNDWSNAGYPYDKRLAVMNVVFDVNGIDQQIVLDTMGGVNGNTFTEGSVAAGTVFTLSNPVIDGAGRASKAFALPDGLIAKLMRVRPYSTATALGQAASVLFKILDVQFEFEKFPPDIVLFTEPKAFSQQEGVARVWRVRIDTGGVACALQLVGDAANVGAAQNVTTTLDDWQRVLTPDPNLIARLWKMRLSPGAGGKAQLFDWSLDVVPEPPLLTSWLSYEINLGADWYKFLKQAWWKYLSASPLNVTLQSETGTYTKQLPAHSGRTTERFYFPVTWGAGLNKSRIYKITVAPTSGTMRFYLDGSGIEFLVLGGDRHAAYEQMPLSELTAFQAA